ncbi:MAG: hypothetical protein ACFE8N_08970 [Promethearchaeota archaeon]
MNPKERNIIICVACVLAAVALLMFIISYSYYLTYSFSFTDPYLYVILDLSLLIFTLLLYAYFIIHPTTTQQGRRKLRIATLIVAAFLILFPLISLSLQLYLFTLHIFSPSYLITLIPFLILLVPGIILLLHGWFLTKRSSIEPIPQ